MPLIQSASKKALQKNIETEIKAGKDPKQAAAIAYNIQRENDALNGVQATKRIESIPISARREMNNSDDRAATLLGILSEMQDIIDSTVQNERNEVKSKAEKILNDLKKQYNLENAKYIRFDDSKKRGFKNMKNFRVIYDNRSFVVRANNNKDAAEKIVNKVLDDGKLVSKYEKEVNGSYVKSAIVEHRKGYSFISSIIKEDRDFNNLESAEAYAQRLGYIATKDSKFKDKRIPSKLKTELIFKTESFVNIYNIKGYVKLSIVDDKITIDAEIGYNMLENLINELTNVINKYGKGAVFDVDKTGKATAILRDSSLKLNDTIEILNTDNYILTLDGNWLEITNRKGESVYSGNTTARTVREAYNMAKSRYIIDGNIKKPEFFAKGKWVWDEIKQDWYDTGAKMYYNELARTNLTNLNDESDLSLLKRYYTEKQPSIRMGLREQLKMLGLKEGVSGVNSSSEMWVELNGRRYSVKNLNSSRTTVSPMDSSIKDDSYAVNNITEAIDKLKQWNKKDNFDLVIPGGKFVRIVVDKNTTPYTYTAWTSRLPKEEFTDPVKASNYIYVMGLDTLFKDSAIKSFKVNYKDRTFVVNARDKKIAAQKILKKFKDEMEEVKDERLSPMTYRKLKELGYSSDKWKGMTQEQANKIVKNSENQNNKNSQKSNETKNEEKSTNTTSSNSLKFNVDNIKSEVGREVAEHYNSNMEWLDEQDGLSADDVEEFVNENVQILTMTLERKYDMEEDDALEISRNLMRPYSLGYLNEIFGKDEEENLKTLKRLYSENFKKSSNIISKIK